MSELSTQGFVQDFLAEAAEHLQSIHTSLLELEQSLSAPPEKLVSRVVDIDQLFRSFHTLKGLAGMIGLDPAARLSHAMESILVEIQKGRLDVSEEVIERLLTGTHTLEQAIETLQNPALPLPDIQPDLTALNELLASGDSSQTGSPGSASDEPGVSRPRIPSEVLEALENYPQINANLSEVDLQAIQSALEAG